MAVVFFVVMLVTDTPGVTVPRITSTGTLDEIVLHCRPPGDGALAAETLQRAFYSSPLISATPFRSAAARMRSYTASCLSVLTGLLPGG